MFSKRIVLLAVALFALFALSVPAQADAGKKPRKLSYKVAFDSALQVNQTDCGVAGGLFDAGDCDTYGITRCYRQARNKFTCNGWQRAQSDQVCTYREKVKLTRSRRWQGGIYMGPLQNKTTICTPVPAPPTG